MGKHSISKGSSPLARGLLSWIISTGLSVGIIPARAGFTRPPCPVSGSTEDHPRSRGVYYPSVRVSGTTSGSSPLARGLRAHHSEPGVRGGIIPARAGFTASPSAHREPAPDHPRSRGVYEDSAPARYVVDGSSPLARGLHGMEGGADVKARIIPARAGFTPWCAPRPAPNSDHPRSRGVYSHAVPPNPRIMGSSPLARGLPRWRTCPCPPRRIIPARAGFT